MLKESGPYNFLYKLRNFCNSTAVIVVRIIYIADENCCFFLTCISFWPNLLSCLWVVRCYRFIVNSFFFSFFFYFRSWKKCCCHVCTISGSRQGRRLEKRWEVNSRKTPLYPYERSPAWGPRRMVKKPVIFSFEDWRNGLSSLILSNSSCCLRSNRAAKKNEWHAYLHCINYFFSFHTSNFCNWITVMTF